MLYLLKLEVDEELKKGFAVIDRPFENWNEVNIRRTGLFWDGKSVFRNIADKYQIGDYLETDIFGISYSYFSFDDRGLGDYVSEDIEDLFEHCIIEEWEDFSEPVVFLMSIQGYTTWTDCGKEYDVDHLPIRRLAYTDFENLQNA